MRRWERMTEKWKMAHGLKWVKNGSKMGNHGMWGHLLFVGHFGPWVISIFPISAFGPFSILYQAISLEKGGGEEEEEEEGENKEGEKQKKKKKKMMMIEEHKRGRKTQKMRNRRTRGSIRK